jgi:Flp pilus assembly protein TadG
MSDERGGVLVMVVLFLPVLIGFAALVIDVGHAFQVRRHLQSAADAAALAAAQELPNTANATAVANDYSASAGARNARPYLPGVTTTVSFPAPTGSKVKVTETATSRVFFAGLFGFDGFDVSASAVASKSSTTTGTPLAVYVHELCGAPTGNKGLISGGLNMRIEGGIHVNGHLEIKNAGFVSVGRATVYRPPPQGTSPSGPPQGPGCKTVDQSDSTYCTGCSGGAVTSPENAAYRDWATPYHTAAHVNNPAFGGVACTHTVANDVKLENEVIPDARVYCLPADKKFTIAGNVTGPAGGPAAVTAVAGFIEVGGTGKLKPYSDAVPVLFYSTNTAGTAVKMNPSAAYDWTGYIINRLGGIVVNAAGVTSPFNGLLEAEWIEINGENFRMLGTFPDSSDGPMFGAVLLEE